EIPFHLRIYGLIPQVKGKTPPHLRIYESFPRLNSNIPTTLVNIQPTSVSKTKTEHLRIPPPTHKRKINTTNEKNKYEIITIIDKTDLNENGNRVSQRFNQSLNEKKLREYIVFKTVTFEKCHAIV